MSCTCVGIDELRECKICGFVVFDSIITIFSIYIASKLFNISLIFAFIIIFIISVIAHYYFGIKTCTNYYLGLSSEPGDNTSQTTSDDLQITTDDSQTIAPVSAIAASVATGATQVAKSVATNVATSAVTPIILAAVV
jgi:hypothetical protein